MPNNTDVLINSTEQAHTSSIVAKGTALRIGSWTDDQPARNICLTLVLSDGKFYEFRFGDVSLCQQRDIKRRWSLTESGDSVEVTFQQSTDSNFLQSFKNDSVDGMLKYAGRSQVGEGN